MGSSNSKVFFCCSKNRSSKASNGSANGITSQPPAQPYALPTIQNAIAEQELHEVPAVAQQPAVIQRSTVVEVEIVAAPSAVVTTAASVIVEKPQIVENEEDFIERFACNESDLAENEMTEIDMGEDKKAVLLIKQKGKYHAVGSKCSHYGAPLIMGALGEGRLRCPYHGACFNIETGDIEDFPGLDAIPCFKTIVEDGKVRIRAKKSDLENDKASRKMTVKDPRNGQIFAIIGGGPSAQTCVETLRQNGFDGRIVMICKEKYLPYDRVKVSKFLNLSIEEIQLRSRTFYDDNQIELMLGVSATKLDTKLKEIALSCGNTLKYDKLFIATGSRAKQLTDLPGTNLTNIFTLRDFNDAETINAALSLDRHVVILGSSYVALECAAYCVEKAAKVTIIGRSNAPLIESFGEAIGTRIMDLFKSKKVEFIMNSGIKSFHSATQQESLKFVTLLNDQVIQADIAIVAIGSELNTDFLLDSGLKVNANGSVDTNAYLETNITDVYCGGDIANSPVYSNNNEPATIGHYALAQYHGRIAGMNMLQLKSELRAVPYFFTYLFGHCFTYTGYGRATEIFVEGDLESLKFVAFYFDEKENVIGMSSCQPDKSIAEFAEKLSQGFHFTKSDIEWVNENEEHDDGEDDD